MRASSRDQCRCHHGHVRGFLQPRLLLILMRKPSHGYELMDALSRANEDASPDPAMVYRTLRQFEESGLVTSRWDTEGPGPARRIYQITDTGREYLAVWVAGIRQTRALLDRFVADYETTVITKEGDTQQ